MATLRKRNFANASIVRSVGRGELQVVELGDLAIGRITYQPGWRWSEDLRLVVGTPTCEVHHVGVALSGRLQIEMDDGSGYIIEPLDAFEIPPGHDAWVVGDEPWISIDTRGRRNFGAPAREPTSRYLATILFVDIVGSTELVRRLGDGAWRDLLADHNTNARAVLERYRGVEIGTIGDGLLATFDSPANAVRAADEIGRSARDLGMDVRGGVHTGEVERAGDDVRGIAVHHAARVAAAAGAGEVLVSSAAQRLLAGSGIRFEALGPHQLKGIDQPDELFRAIVPR
jgi:class 3 adenylate cyclase